ncbi:MAG: transposase [Streptococcus salivarius]
MKIGKEYGHLLLFSVQNRLKCLYLYFGVVCNKLCKHKRNKSVIVELQHITRRFIPIHAENLEMAVQALEDFIAEWKPKYSKVMENLENTDNLLTFISFPIRFGTAFIRQTSLSLSTKIKRQTKRRGLTRRLWNVI